MKNNPILPRESIALHTHNTGSSSSEKYHYSLDAPGNAGLYARMRKCGHCLFHRSIDKISQQRILAIIHDNNDHISQRSLLDILQVRSASISEILSKLEVQGFIQKKHNAIDRRNIDVFLTPSGKSVVKEFHQQQHQMLSDLFDVLNPDEKKQLSALLGKLLSHWNN